METFLDPVWNQARCKLNMVSISFYGVIDMACFWQLVQGSEGASDEGQGAKEAGRREDGEESDTNILTLNVLRAAPQTSLSAGSACLMFSSSSLYSIVQYSTLFSIFVFVV